MLRGVANWCRFRMQYRRPCWSAALRLSFVHYLPVLVAVSGAQLIAEPVSLTAHLTHFLIEPIPQSVFSDDVGFSEDVRNG